MYLYMAPYFSKAEGLASFEDERKHLEREVLAKEWEQQSEGSPKTREGLIKESLDRYKDSGNKALLHPDHVLKPVEAGAITLQLSPRSTDEKIEGLIHTLHEHGIWNTLQIVEKLKSPELEDDFHRFLVQYLKTGFEGGKLERKSTLFEALQMTLYEIMLPEATGEEREAPLKELLSSMEQFYAGMAGALQDKGEQTLSFELTVPNKGTDMIAYAAVPDRYRDLFEKQLLSIFPAAKIREEKNDYNIFREHDVVVASTASFGSNGIFPIKLYDQFDYDPLNIVSNAFSKMAHEGEGAAIQIQLHNPGTNYLSKYKQALHEISTGKPLEEAIDIRSGFLSEAAKEIGKEIKHSFFGSKKKEKEIGEKERVAIEAINRKTESPILLASLRIVVSAGTRERAEALLRELEASFNQFENTNGNRFVFNVATPKEVQALIRNFSFRLFDQHAALPLSLKELATVFHIPRRGIEGTPFVRQAHFASAPAPSGMDQDGLLIGINQHRAVDTPVYLSVEDRARHLYVVGQTGTGKTGLLKHMILEDIKRGEGVCMIDPHGSDILDVLGQIPESRRDDVIYFDPAYTARPMGLNLLEYDPRFPEQKTFIVNELLSIFKKLFGDAPESMGPAFEQYFRNSTLLVMAHPESGNTLVEVARVLSDKAFRALKLSHATDPLLLQFWKNAEATKGEMDMANFAQYVTNKFDQFLSNEIIRPVVAQEHSAFNFREVMDQQKILLVNLSKGRLGDINAYLIGLVLVGKILIAALSRADTPTGNFPPFYLYIDEFQNITTDSIQTILSEARKYKLSLTVAHQFMKQLDEKTRDAVIGNVGSLAVFRVGEDDAEYLEKLFTPVFSAKDIMNLDNRHAYVKTLVRGKPVRPFNIETITVKQGSGAVTEVLQRESYDRYGKDRSEVEAAILKKYGLV